MSRVAKYNGKTVFHVANNIVKCPFDIKKLSESMSHRYLCQCAKCPRLREMTEEVSVVFLAMDKDGVCVEVKDMTKVFPANLEKRVIVGEQKVDIAYHVYHMKVVRAIYMGMMYCRLLCTARGFKEIDEAFVSYRLHMSHYYGTNYTLDTEHIKIVLDFLDYDKEVYPMMDNQDIRDDVADILDVTVDEPDPGAEMYVKIVLGADYQVNMHTSHYIKYAAMTLMQKNSVFMFSSYVGALDMYTKRSFLQNGKDIDEEKLMEGMCEMHRKNPHINACFLALFPNAMIIEF